MIDGPCWLKQEQQIIALHKADAVLVIELPWAEPNLLHGSPRLLSCQAGELPQSHRLLPNLGIRVAGAYYTKPAPNLIRGAGRAFSESCPIPPPPGSAAPQVGS